MSISVAFSAASLSVAGLAVFGGIAPAATAAVHTAPRSIVSHSQSPLSDPPPWQCNSPYPGQIPGCGQFPGQHP